MLVLLLLATATAAVAAAAAASPFPLARLTTQVMLLPPPTPAAALPTFSAASALLDAAPRFIFLPGLDAKVSANSSAPFSLQLVNDRQQQRPNVSAWNDVPLGLRNTNDGAALLWVVAEIPAGERVRACVV